VKDYNKVRESLRSRRQTIVAREPESDVEETGMSPIMGVTTNYATAAVDSEELEEVRQEVEQINLEGEDEVSPVTRYH
jgi:hypothetical protein